MFIQYGNISLPCQSSNSPAFIQSPKNPWLLQRWRDNDWSVTEWDGGWGGPPSCGLVVSQGGSSVSDSVG